MILSYVILYFFIDLIIIELIVVVCRVDLYVCFGYGLGLGYGYVGIAFLIILFWGYLDRVYYV